MKEGGNDEDMSGGAVGVLMRKEAIDELTSQVISLEFALLV